MSALFDIPRRVLRRRFDPHANSWTIRRDLALGEVRARLGNLAVDADLCHHAVVGADAADLQWRSGAARPESAAGGVAATGAVAALRGVGIGAAPGGGCAARGPGGAARGLKGMAKEFTCVAE